jgi:hypothetical protein
MENAYTGAPDECGPCFIEGNIRKLDTNGDCPICKPSDDDGYSFCAACKVTHHYSYGHCKAA